MYTFDCRNNCDGYCICAAQVTQYVGAHWKKRSKYVTTTTINLVGARTQLEDVKCAGASEGEVLVTSSNLSSEPPSRGQDNDRLRASASSAIAPSR